MISFKARAQMLDRIDLELKSEMAASLSRISKKLETLISQLLEIRVLAEMEDKTRKQYAELHEQAQLYYWYLMVQRESIGIRNHDALKQLYRIPDKILPVKTL